MGDDIKSDVRPARGTKILAGSVAELLELSDVEFVHSAYMLLLRRKADAEGERYFTTKLRSGVAKPQILLALASSKEARIRPAAVPGLRRTLLAARLAKMPFFRTLASLGLSKHSSSRRAQTMRRLDNEVHRLRRANEDMQASLDGLLGKIERLNTRVIMLESVHGQASAAAQKLVSVEQLIARAQ